ncbi:MAG: glutathione S-transferase family protein [Reyranella sp.]
MDPILFYGVPAGCSFGAIVALEWSGRPYRLCRIEMPAVVASPAYRRFNPLGETPTFLSDTGEVFSQSLAILQHIARSSSDPRMGPGPATPDFDRLIESLSFLHTSLFSAFSPLWQAFEGAEEGEKEVLRAIGRRRVRKAFDQLARLLGGRTWLVGDGPTVADAYFMAIVRWNDFHKVLDPADHPTLEALRARLEREPAVQFALAVEHGQEARSSGQFRGHVALAEASRDARLAA